MTYLHINPDDHDSMIAIMDKYGDSDKPYHGTTSDCASSQRVDIFQDHITTTTYQDNGYTKITTYWKDGHSEEYILSSEHI